MSVTLDLTSGSSLTPDTWAQANKWDWALLFWADRPASCRGEISLPSKPDTEPNKANHNNSGYYHFLNA